MVCGSVKLESVEVIDSTGDAGGLDSKGRVQSGSMEECSMIVISSQYLVI